MPGQDTFHYKGLPDSQDDKMALRSISRLEVTSPNKSHVTLVKCCKFRAFSMVLPRPGLSVAIFIDPVSRLEYLIGTFSVDSFYFPHIPSGVQWQVVG